MVVLILLGVLVFGLLLFGVLSLFESPEQEIANLERTVVDKRAAGMAAYAKGDLQRAKEKLEAAELWQDKLDAARRKLAEQKK